MSDETIRILKDELAKGRSGLVRRYLDARIELLSDSEDAVDSLKPFADRLLHFTWTVRKVADMDEKLALDCFEDGLELMIWILSDTKERLHRISS
ncbi:MAG: hypothetical protein ABSG45_09020 [Nitrososphaerales archaeon]